MSKKPRFRLQPATPSRRDFLYHSGMGLGSIALTAWIARRCFGTGAAWIAAGLIARGMEPGDRFALLMRNHPEFVETMIAASISAAMVGTTRFHQWWFRDPPAAFGSGLSDALEATFCP